MWSRRAAWIALNFTSSVCSILFVALLITTQISSDWVVYDIASLTTITDVNQASRVRGTWNQCVQDLGSLTPYSGKCYTLEPFDSAISYNDAVQIVLSLRMTIVALQIVVTITVTLTIIISSIILILLWKNSGRFKPRTGQYTVLGSGIAHWLSAQIYFISLVLYYETISQENYRLDATLKSARASWSTNVRGSTIASVGGMVPLAWFALICLHLSSILQLIASTLQEPPSIEAGN